MSEQKEIVTSALTFEQLLDANEVEAQRWQRWFERQPAAVLELPIDIAGAGTVRNFLLHIFAVELRYAERLLEFADVTAYETLPAGSIEELFGIGTKARAMYREFLGKTCADDEARILEFMTRTAGMLKASKRKIFVHAMLHGVRHWAQLATALRAAGYKTDWPHDFLYSTVME